MKQQYGFGLLEVLTALVIAMTVAFGALTLSGRALVSSNHAKQRADASFLIDNQRQMLSLMNEQQKDIFAQNLNRLYQAVQGERAPIVSYAKQAMNLGQICYRQLCSDEQFAISYAIDVAQMASNQRLLPAVVPCATGKCLAVAWGVDAVKNLQSHCQDKLAWQMTCVLAELP